MQNPIQTVLRKPFTVQILSKSRWSWAICSLHLMALSEKTKCFHLEKEKPKEILVFLDKIWS